MVKFFCLFKLWKDGFINGCLALLWKENTHVNFDLIFYLIFTFSKKERKGISIGSKFGVFGPTSCNYETELFISSFNLEKRTRIGTPEKEKLGSLGQHHVRM